MQQQTTLKPNNSNWKQKEKKNIHFLGKCGKERSSNPSGILFPLIACWPTQAIICEMLIKEPLDPLRAMMRGLLVWWSSDLQAFPADSRITESSCRIFAYQQNSNKIIIQKQKAKGKEHGEERNSPHPLCANIEYVYKNIKLTTPRMSWNPLVIALSPSKKTHTSVRMHKHSSPLS